MQGTGMKWGEGPGGRPGRQVEERRAGRAHRAGRLEAADPAAAGRRREQPRGEGRGAGLGAGRAPARQPAGRRGSQRAPPLPQDFLRQHAHSRVCSARGGCCRPRCLRKRTPGHTQSSAACSCKGRARQPASQPASLQPSSRATSSSPRCSAASGEAGKRNGILFLLLICGSDFLFLLKKKKNPRKQTNKKALLLLAF